jgi:hypothetical protein
VRKVVTLVAQMAPEAPPVVLPEEKGSAGQGAGEVMRNSNSSSDGFCQLGVTTFGVPPSVEMLAAFEAELQQQISSVAAGEHAATSGGLSPRRLLCVQPLLRWT